MLNINFNIIYNFNKNIYIFLNIIKNMKKFISPEFFVSQRRNFELTWEDSQHKDYCKDSHDDQK